uniref:Chromosome 1 open reading frame 87 n=1 Tax=Propithecus coquereli TaxID=379532 RepID=A0A2K6FXR4_PROCO
MSAVWKTPCGSDAMPEITVKIVGSKHFRYLVEKPKTKEDENMKTETQTVLQKPLTGNASLPAPTNLTDEQTNYNPDGGEERKHPENIQKPENNQKLLTGANNSRFLDGKIPIQANGHCSSVPTGDQSLSYVHGLPRRRLRDWSLEQMVSRGSNQPEDVGPRSSGTRKEDTFLLALVRRELKSHPLSSSLLDKLQKELQILDAISSGCLLQSQLSRLFLRHGVPLQLPTVKILCQRFSRRGSPEMVNYGKLLLFLKGAVSDNPQQSKTVVDSNLKKTESISNHSQSTAPQDSSPQSEVNKSLLEILKMALKTTNGKLNTENLNLSFRKEDRSFSGCLPPPKVRAICGKHGLHLTLSLLETLLNHQDLGYQDEIKWQNFVEMLSRASSDLLADLPTGKNEKEAPATLVEPKVPETSQSKTEHMKTPEEEPKPETPPAETLAPKDSPSSLKIRPASQPFVSPAMNKESEESEMWIDRFRKLENALYLCDLSNTGVLEKDRARRLIHNYNLIYNLSLSPRKIDQALRRFRSGENMLLEPALQYLKEL